MPKERPTPPPFEPAELERSLNRYLAVGLVFMVVLIAGFAAYRVREPSLRKDAAGLAAGVLPVDRRPAVRHELLVLPRQGRGRRAAHPCSTPKSS